MAATEAATKATTNTTDESWLETHPYPRIFYDEPEPEDSIAAVSSVVSRVVSIALRDCSWTARMCSRPEADSFSTTKPMATAASAPDFLITFDVDSAWIWAEPTQLPDMGDWQASPFRGMEVASPSTAANDLGRKRDLYERLGVQEYWRFDATGGDHVR